MQYLGITIVHFFLVIPIFSSEDIKQRRIVNEICSRADGSCFDEASCDFVLGKKVNEDGEENPNQSNPPDNLQYAIEFDLPVGFRRLRKALLNEQSLFWTETILQNTLQYTEISFSKWDRLDTQIGLENISSAVKEIDYIGASKTTNYLMPESILIKANKAIEHAVISAYNSNFFVLKKSTVTPDVPFGSRFVALSQIVVVNTGKNSCRMICSVEADFPNGEPLGAGRSIRYAMKKAAMTTYEKIRDTILDTCPAE